MNHNRHSSAHRTGRKCTTSIFTAQLINFCRLIYDLKRNKYFENIIPIVIYVPIVVSSFYTVK